MTSSWDMNGDGDGNCDNIDRLIRIMEMMAILVMVVMVSVVIVVVMMVVMALIPCRRVWRWLQQEHWCSTDGVAPALGVWRGRPELSQDLNLIPEGKVWWGIKNASLEGSKECRVFKGWEMIRYFRYWVDGKKELATIIRSGRDFVFTLSYSSSV